VDASSLRTGSVPDAREEYRTGSGPAAWTADVLRDHEMPSDEIGAVLTTDDPELVHRYLELHRERLEEWLTDQRRTLATLEWVLAKTAAERRRLRDVGGR